MCTSCIAPVKSQTHHIRATTNQRNLFLLPHPGEWSFLRGNHITLSKCVAFVYSPLGCSELPYFIKKSFSLQSLILQVYFSHLEYFPPLLSSFTLCILLILKPQLIISSLPWETSTFSTHSLLHTGFYGSTCHTVLPCPVCLWKCHSLAWNSHCEAAAKPLLGQKTQSFK